MEATDLIHHLTLQEICYSTGGSQRRFTDPNDRELELLKKHSETQIQFQIDHE